MQEYSFEKSLILKPLSRTPSTRSSIICTPDPYKSKKNVLHKSLCIKQSVLSNQLIKYSNNLIKKLPEIAQQWENVNSRYKNLRKNIQITRDKIEFFYNHEKQQNNADLLEKLLTEVERQNDSENNELLKIIGEVNFLKQKIKEKKFFDGNYKEKILDIEKIRLSEKLEKIKTLKNSLVENLKLIKEGASEIKKHKNDFVHRIEEIKKTKEEIKFLKIHLPEIEENKKKESDDNEKIRNQNKLLRERVHLLIKKYQESRKNNSSHDLELKKLNDRLQAKLALIKLENQHIDDQKTKFSKFKCIITEMNMKINKKIAEMKIFEMKK